MRYEHASAMPLLRIAGWFAAFLLGAGSCAGLAAAELKSGESVYKETCFACHATGVAGAPKYADKKTWVPLIKEGQPVLTAHAWVGVRGMPAKGGRADLSLEEFARAVAYMARAADGSWKDPDAKILKRIQEEEKERIKGMNSKKK
jgi:cytochrome c5